MKPKTIKKEFLLCPHCNGGEHDISHFGDTLVRFGPWYCDKCGGGIQGRRETGTGKIDIDLLTDKRVNTVDLLVLKPQKDPVYFLVPGQWSEPMDDGVRFVYDENSCPTNWFKPFGIKIGNDTDPHGLFRYVGSVDGREKKEDETDWFDSFKETIG